MVEHLFKRLAASNPWCETSGEVSGRLHQQNTYVLGTVRQQPQKTHTSIPLPPTMNPPMTEHILTNLKLEQTHRRRIMTEEKAKVVSSVWGEEFVQFLAALVVLPIGRF